MEEKIQKAGAMSPQKLLIGFSRDRIIFWISVAIGFHILLIGSLSLGYIRDRWIDPTGAEERKAAALAAQEAVKKEAAAKVTRSPVAAMGTGSASNRVVQVGSSSTGTPEQILEERKNAPVVKRITEKAAPGEIPTRPNDLGISLDDINVH